MRQAEPGLETRSVGDDRQPETAPRQLHEGQIDVWVEDQVGVARPPVGDNRAGEDLVVDPAQLFLQKEIKDLLVFDPLTVVDLVDLPRDLVAGKLQPGVDHPVHRRVDRRVLHLHEVGERIVEIEYDGLDHSNSLKGPKPLKPSNPPKPPKQQTPTRGSPWVARTSALGPT